MPTLNDSLQSQIAWMDARSQYQCQEASIVSLDSRTVTISTPEAIPLQQPCAITILNRDGQVLFAAQATPRFIRDYELARHTTCQWCNHLERDALTLLANLRLYNRRQGNRNKVAINAPARQELSSGEVLPVSVIDLSINGCCIKSPSAVPVGDRLAIHPVETKHANDTVFVRVKWQQQSGDHYLLGCEFTRRSGYEKLVSYAVKSSNSQRPIANASRNLTHTLLNISQAGVSLAKKTFGNSDRAVAAPPNR